MEKIKTDNIESVIAISSIIRLKLRHGLQLTQNDIQKIKKVLLLYKTLQVNSLLDESEMEYLEEDIAIIEYKYKELEK